MNDIKIDLNVSKVFNNIDKIINEIESNLQKLYDISVIDNNYWNTKEYEIYSKEYLNYLKSIKNIYPTYLRNYLEFMKGSVKKYKNIDLLDNSNL